MEITNTIISNALTAVETEIARLNEVRDNLLTLVEEFEVTETPKTRRPSGVRSTKASAKVTRKPAKAEAKKVTRRDEIIALLEDDWSPREIADELGIKPNYVYHVKADLVAA